MGRRLRLSRVQTLTSSASISVLIVDDNEDHRLLMGRRLREAGIRVRTATTGREAVTSLDGIDIVLLDYRLPDMTGIETLSEIRAAGGPSVVMVTGMGSETTVVESMRAGAIDYVVKDAAYLGNLPGIVQRAYRHHDLDRRANELQRLTLLVSSASERGVVLSAVVEGAQRLLRADACRLCLTASDGRLHWEAERGETGHDRDALLRESFEVLRAGATSTSVGSVDRLLLPIPSIDSGLLGVLAILTIEPREYLPEELELARTFASFAGIAVGKIHQLEMERALVDQLQQTLDLRRQLVVSLSHELRTPLTCVMGFATALQQSWDALDENARKDLVGRIERNADDLHQLVEQLLDFAGVEGGRLVAQPQVLVLADEIDAAVRDMSTMLDGRTLVVEVDDVHVRGDAHFLRRTLWNLLSNAAKYGDPTGRIEVRARRKGDVVRVEVTDNGQGMTAEEAGRVFEPFWRAEATRITQRGTGIGLALTRDYVRLMDGDIGVQSEIGRGSTFFFTLPAA